MDEYEDIGESSLESKDDGTWKAGESGNPAGRPKGSKNTKPRSKMRSTLTKLYTLQADAIEIIKESLKKPVKGAEVVVDKTQLDTAKFVIKAIESLNNTCLREEMSILGVRLKDEVGANALADNQAEEEPKQPTFSMNMEELETQIKH